MEQRRSGRGRRSEIFSFSPGQNLIEEGREEKRIKSERIGNGEISDLRPARSGEDQSALERYLADNPAMTARDFKGKGFTDHAPFDKYYVASGEPPWDKLDRDEVRRLAIRNKARFLSRGQRQAAARDPGLIWDERSRSYRLRAEATPAPPETKQRGGGGHES